MILFSHSHSLRQLLLKIRQPFWLISLILAVCFISVVVALSPNLLNMFTSNIRYPQIDTIGHFTSFFMLSWLVHSLIKVPLTITILTLSFYGALTELGQLYLGFRNGELIDFLADVAGILFFAFTKLTYSYLVKLTRQKKASAKHINLSN